MIKIPYNDLFNEMIKDQTKMRHCLFVGPPGSGKTTAAQEFCRRLIGPQNTWIGRVLFLNASDERSLEAVRTKVYPFARSTLTTIFQFTQKSNNKVIIFDEAETLTEQAQLSLRPLLNLPAKEICIFFLCNSSSRLHPSLINRFCVLPFFPPPPSVYLSRVKAIMNESTVKIAPLDALFTRCDIRSFLYHQTRGAIVTKFIFSLLTCPLYEVSVILEKQARFFFLKDVLSQIVFSFASLGLASTDEVCKILLLGNSDVLRVIPEQQWSKTLQEWIWKVRQKFDCCV